MYTVCVLKMLNFERFPDKKKKVTDEVPSFIVEYDNYK